MHGRQTSGDGLFPVGRKELTVTGKRLTRVENPRRPVGLLAVMVLVAGGLLTLGLWSDALMPITRLSPYQASQIAKASAPSSSQGTTRVIQITAAPAVAWGIPASQIAGSRLVWQVVLSGHFELLCGGTAMCAPPIPSAGPSLACPLIPTTLSAVWLCGQYASQVTVEIEDSNGKVLGITYQDWGGASQLPPAPLAVRHPRNGEGLTLSLNQELRLGTPSLSLVWSRWQVASGAVLQTLPKASGWGQWFVAQREGEAQLSIVGRPRCKADAACPQFILLMRVEVRVN